MRDKFKQTLSQLCGIIIILDMRLDRLTGNSLEANALIRKPVFGQPVDCGIIASST